jgi:hypothetical protein
VTDCWAISSYKYLLTVKVAKRRSR